MPTSKDTVKADHLSRILDAASALFLEIGFARTTINDIAKRARVSKREIYLHFADRRDVLSGCIKRLQGDVVVEMKTEWASEADIRSVLVHAGHTILKLMLSEKFRNVFRLVAAESLTDNTVAKQFYRLGPATGRHEVGKYLEKQIHNGTLIPIDPLRAADDFLDLVITARVITAVALGSPVRIVLAKDHVEHAVDVFLTYYTTQHPTGRRSQDR